MDDIKKLWGIMIESFDRAERRDATTRFKNILDTCMHSPEVAGFVREKIIEYADIIEWRSWHRNSQFERFYGTDDKGEYIPTNSETAFLSIGINTIPFLDEILKLGNETEIKKVDYVLKSIFHSLKSLNDIREFDIRLRNLIDTSAESCALFKGVRKNFAILLALAAGKRCARGDMEAIGNLIEALKDKDEDICAAAANELEKIKDPCSVPALIEAMGINSVRVRGIVVSALERIVRNYKTFNELEQFEKRLMERFEILVKKPYNHEEELSIIRIQFSRLSSLAARKKNTLSKKYDIILDDKPKPPKKGGVYQQMRRIKYG